MLAIASATCQRVTAAGLQSMIFHRSRAIRVQSVDFSLMFFGRILKTSALQLLKEDLKVIKLSQLFSGQTFYKLARNNLSGYWNKLNRH